MSGKPCPPGCRCRKHYLTAEHRAKMSVSVSAAMKQSWARRRQEPAGTRSGEPVRTHGKVQQNNE